MKKVKLNKFQIIAGISAIIYFGIGHFVSLPDVVEGLSLGICVAFFPLGSYTMNHDTNKIYNFKKQFFRRIMKKA